MATVVARRVSRPFGPDSAGTPMTPREFDHADFVEGWRYELLDGRLIVTPIPLENERDPNGELGYWLRHYRDTNPQGAALDATLFEHTVKTGKNRRRADRVIWAGLGRLPRKGETPTIIAEFVSSGRRSRERDYVEKRDAYMAVRVKEYWIIDTRDDPERPSMTVFRRRGKRWQTLHIPSGGSYTTKLLPGFRLALDLRG